MEPTNQDLLARIDALETKVDMVLQKMSEAKGAWLFAKWLGGIVLTLIAFSDNIRAWWLK